MKKRIFFAVVCLAAFAMVGCGEQEPTAPGVAHDEELQVAAKQVAVTGGPEEGVYSPTLAALNAKAEELGLNVRLEMAEYLAAPETGEVGRTIYASDRGNKQMDAHWVPGDPGRDGRTDITYAVDLFDGATASGLTPAQTTAAIQRAMATWNEESCSDIPIVGPYYMGQDLGVIQYILGFGGAPYRIADITHAGWLPGAFFEILEPGGSDFILGVTFTFGWIDAEGVAFRETYYNDNFFWGIDTNEYDEFDVESVVLHEAGHGLSQWHFGEIFITQANGKAHFAPRAVMNALYSGVQQELVNTDIGGHCSIWASWPNN